MYYVVLYIIRAEIPRIMEPWPALLSATRDALYIQTFPEIFTFSVGDANVVTQRILTQLSRNLGEKS